MTRRWQLGALGMLAACCFSVILAHAYVGSFSRFMADTYCYAANAAAYGLIGAQRYWYTSWTGRFSLSLAESLTGLSGPSIAPLLPPTVLLLWSLVLVGTVAQLDLFSGRLASILGALLLGGLILSTTLSNIPSVSQSLYWSNGMSNYAPPLILSTAYAGLFAYAQKQTSPSRRTRVSLVLCAAIIAFVAGGFSEMAGTLQISALLVLLLAVSAFGSPASRKGLLPIGIAGLLGAALALGIVIIAPGNKIRQAYFPPPPGILKLIGLAWQLTTLFLQNTLLKHPVNLLAAVVIPGALGSGWLAAGERDARFPLRGLVKILIGAPVVTLGLLLSSFGAAAYGLSGSPPARAQIVPQYFLVVSLVAWGFALGCMIRQANRGTVFGRERYFWQVALGCALVVCGLNALQAGRQRLASKAIFEAYALAWDGSTRLILDAHSHGITRVSVPPVRSVSGLEEAGADVNHWVNQCVSRYYGVTVVANQPLPAPAPSELQRMTPIDGRIGDVARIEGYTLATRVVRAGETLSVTVYWRPEAISNQPYTVFVHLYDPGSGSIAQVDTYPAQGTYPTTQWVYDHLFADTYLLSVPKQFSDAREAEIVIGLYDLQTMQRLPVAGADAQADQSWVRFGRVRVNY